MLGLGGIARTFLEAFLVVRPIKTVKVYSPTKDHHERFAREMSAKHNIDVIAVDSPEKAVRSVDILSTCTDSMVPTVSPEWLEPGMHLANLGPAEIGGSVMAQVDVVIRQGTSGLRVVKNDRVVVGIGPVAFVAGTDEKVKRLPERTPPISGFKPDSANYSDIIRGKVAGRTAEIQITLYRNMGNRGLQFSSVGSIVYEKAKQQNLGRELPTEWFLREIRD